MTNPFDIAFPLLLSWICLAVRVGKSIHPSRISLRMSSGRSARVLVVNDGALRLSLVVVRLGSLQRRGRRDVSENRLALSLERSDVHANKIREALYVPYSSQDLGAKVFQNGNETPGKLNVYMMCSLDRSNEVEEDTWKYGRHLKAPGAMYDEAHAFNFGTDVSLFQSQASICRYDSQSLQPGVDTQPRSQRLDSVGNGHWASNKLGFHSISTGCITRVPQLKSAEALTLGRFPCPLNISGIAVDSRKSKLDIESAKVWIGDSHVPIERKGRKSLRRTFSPPVVLSHGDKFSLHMDCLDKPWFNTKTEDFLFNPEEMFRVYSASKGHEYTTHHNKIKIVIYFSRNPTTIPRFRILVIGKTGVGKSSLISHIFGVEEMINLPGASIDHEFISPQNDKFVLHGSKGFGLRDNLETIRDFIDRRRNMSPEHQLHAVWLVNQIQQTLDKTSLKGLSNEAIKELAKKNAEAELQDICIRPLEKFAGSKIPHAAISSVYQYFIKFMPNEDYKKTLAHLIQITENCVSQHFASKATVVTSIRVAQRVDPGLKIKASFDVRIAKKRYRKTFSCCCTIFKKRKMWDFLHVLHTDIVNVWNFYDLHHHLNSQKFRESIIKMVEVEPTKGHRHFFSRVPVIQHFMSYIVHLTLVSQTLYFVSGGREITRRAIKLAVSSYLTSPMRTEARTWIQACDRQLTILDCVDQDRIVEGIRSYTINATQRVERQENTQRAEHRENIHPSAPINTPAIVFHPTVDYTPTINYTPAMNYPTTEWFTRQG
ncbi:uncharacterized protein F5147DRAFT_758763 [Suillus discolor]|uniref:G domain-containing protein n=1 Tax=Suillus discolor TaxID=1912936 RepID=A0A9P7FCY5_9AGAM|nr:uncharacterized protein F5147DRAFT_758763 [Suillus discolor]KAG2114623.1 hypothetical protein F5147DRAFT_758763 [Suillus discolor]